MKRALLLLSLLTLAAASPGCGRKIRFKAARATPTRVESTVTTTSAGTVEAEQQAVLSFSGGGRIRKIAVRVGQRVRRGEILAELENFDLLRIRQDAEREVNRATELFSSGLMSRVALDDAKRALEIARMNLERSMIRAPFDGVVTEMNLELGEAAQLAPNPQKPPIRLIDEKERFIKGSIDELDLAKVRVGAPSRIRVLASRPAPYKAEVKRLVPFVSTIKEQDRTSQVEFRLLEKPENLLPTGASADIEIIVEAKDSALAIPARTVLGLGDQRYVFVLEDQKLRKRPVKIGLGNFERREVLTGLQAGDVVAFPPDDAELKEGLKGEAEIIAWP